MRTLYDPPELVEAMRAAAKLTGKGAQSKHRELLKESKVRRSDQGRGAMEADLVIQGCPLWLELQDAKDPRPYEKLAQAERDRGVAQSPLRPVAIIHKLGSPTIQAWMRAETLLYLMGFEDLTNSEGGVIPLSDAPGAAVVVMLDYEELLDRLRFRRDVELAKEWTDGQTEAV